MSLRGSTNELVPRAELRLLRIGRLVVNPQAVIVEFNQA
jgi:hypothetical protein